MKLEMRRALARESFEEKIRKVEQLIRLAKTFPRSKDKTRLKKQESDLAHGIRTLD